jgi:excisionase family DNA binding protein
MQLESAQSPTHDNEQQAPQKTQLFLTPEEVSKQLRVTAEQVRNLIRQGRISAVNIGAGKKRPLYRIRQQALDDFMDNSRQRNQPGTRKKLRRLPHGPDFFPDLR